MDDSIPTIIRTEHGATLMFLSAAADRLDAERALSRRDLAKTSRRVIWEAAVTGPAMRDAGASLVKALDEDVTRWMSVIPTARLIDLREPSSTLTYGAAVETVRRETGIDRPLRIG